MRKSTPLGICLMLTLGLAGCEERQSSVRFKAPSLAPSPAPPPVPPVPSVPQELWILTGTYIGHTGPEACIPPFDGNPRKPIDSKLVILRSGESIDLLTEHDHYVGTVTADGFSATTSNDGTWQCGEARLQYRTEARVSGRFSLDGRSFTGKEEVLFRLESGETISRQWDWSATRQ